MASNEFDVVLNDIRGRVATAVSATGMGAKPFAVKNKMGETVVRDLIKAHNKDVQLSTLAKIAKGSGISLLDLLPQDDRPLVTLQSLERAIADALPGLPKAADRRAEYLAATVADALQLPSGLRDAPGNDERQEQGDNDEAAPAR